ncbi:PEP/pyruvate-binding domain-containing protein [Streptomyces spiramyceticus]|uniref:PEP/pyruvate-binding domain-containing protein n=1 Tax=Streptomyces spiramyceticus TaxID=299717 RepID=UPI00237A5BFB|nr:PEP/pyruvate-binding domain-containing protein [Streptomyces spiramyceticus]
MVSGLERLAVIPLEAAEARNPALTGAKAANLARAAAAGLPVLPGFAIVPAASAAQSAAGVPHGESALHAAWRELTGEEGRALVVRSSSAHEDAADSSMAGLFASVLDVHGWENFTAAVSTVLDSAARRSGEPAEAGSVGEPAGGMAVLVQPMLRTAVGGVMFGADPVAGREDRMLVSVVQGGPDQLLAGSAQGVRYQLTRHGRLAGAEPREPRRDRLLGRRRISHLVRLARRAERVFGGPQDMEFGFDTDNRLWLFQARPITAMTLRAARGTRLLGPGPVAETFPEVLQPLEEDLWVAPMSHGLTLALDIAGTASRRRLRELPVVTTVDGRAAADLRLLGAIPSAHPVLDFINPVPGARRASAAWRVGRLGTALPLLAVDLMADVDRELAQLPAPRAMLSGQIMTALTWGRNVLSSLHAQESLAGSLLGQGSGATAVGEALAVLAEGRTNGTPDAELLARHPVLLSLLPPSLARPAQPPERTGWTGAPRGVAALPVREGLRLRIRWVQEMQASLVRELAARMEAAGRPDALRKLSMMRWHELTAVLDGAPAPADLDARLPRPDSPPLPAAFRLSPEGRPIAERLVSRGRHRGRGGGQGAGGGYGYGTAWHGHGPRPEHPVLVVRALDPALATELPDLAGLVAETGSVLSHLAVLAREHKVPTVVGVPDAVERFPQGTELTVDGTNGSVEPVRAGAEQDAKDAA